MTGASGDIGREARALVEAARDWAARTLPESHSAECQWCPVCRTLAAVRDPDVAERVAAVLSTAAGALASLLDSLSRAAPEPPSPPAQPDVHEIPLDEGP